MMANPDNLSGIKVISFDLDDTLWPLEATLIKAEELLYAWLQEHTPEVTRNNSADEVFQHRRRFAEQHPELCCDVTQLRTQSLEQLLAEHGYEPPMHQQAFDFFYHARSQVKLFPGTLGVLERLQTRYQLAALTNGNADLDIVGIAHVFSDIQLASLDMPAKPDRAMFDACAENLQVKNEEILHIGDNMETDVGGGQNAGVLTGWFNPTRLSWPDGQSHPDVDIQSLAGLEQLLMSVNPN